MINYRRTNQANSTNEERGHESFSLPAIHQLTFLMFSYSSFTRLEHFSLCFHFVSSSCFVIMGMEILITLPEMFSFLICYFFGTWLIVLHVHGSLLTDVNSLYYQTEHTSSFSVSQLRQKGPIRGTSAAHEQWGKSTKPCHDDVIKDTSTTMRKWPWLRLFSSCLTWFIGGVWQRLVNSTVQILPQSQASCSFRKKNKKNMVLHTYKKEKKKKLFAQNVTCLTCNC